MTPSRFDITKVDSKKKWHKVQSTQSGAFIEGLTNRYDPDHITSYNVFDSKGRFYKSAYTISKAKLYLKEALANEQRRAEENE